MAQQYKGRAEAGTAIALCAAAMCEDGDTIILCGDAAEKMADFLFAKRMRIITNSLRIASRLTMHSENEVLFTGGVMQAGDALRVTPDNSFARNFCADKVFLGAAGLRLHGVVADAGEDKAARHLARQGQEVIVLAESWRLAGLQGQSFGGQPRVSRVITDHHLTGTCRSMLQRHGIAVQTALALH